MIKNTGFEFTVLLQKHIGFESDAFNRPGTFWGSSFTGNLINSYDKNLFEIIIFFHGFMHVPVALQVLREYYKVAGTEAD